MKKNNGKIVLFYIVLIVGIFLVLSFLFSNKDAKDPTYGEIVTYFESDTVKSYTIDDSNYLTLRVYDVPAGSQIDKATGLPSVLWYDEFVEVLTVESQRILLGEVSVEEGLATMQAKCEALEAEYAK